MKRPVLEKNVQAQIVAALRIVGGKVYTIGRPPRRDAVFKGTGQTPGIPDLLVHLPYPPRMPGNGMMRQHELWIEVKANGGRLSPEQALFRDFCQLAGIPHIVGGLDEVYTYLLEHGYVKESGVPHYRLPKAGAA